MSNALQPCHKHISCTIRVLFLLVFAAAFGLCLWRCSYGFSEDEPFYYTIPLRLLQGDSFLFDEWHVSQLSYFMLLPFVKLFITISGSTEGILLAGRYTYVLIHFAAALLIRYKLRRYGPVSYFVSLSYALFAPHEIMAYYYNTIAMDSLVLSMLFLIENEHGKISRSSAAVSGLLFAMCVLACPYMLLAFLAFSVFILCFGRKKPDRYFSAEVLLFFTLGAASLAVIFLCYLFSRVSLSEILASLPLIFSDPEHPPLPLWDRCVTIFFSTWRCHPKFHYALIAFAAMLASICFDRRRKAHRGIYFLFSIFITLFCYAIFAPLVATKYYNAIMLPLVFPGFTAYILCENKPVRAFICLFAVGFIYALCLCFASNLFFLVIPQAISIANIASLLFIAELIKELNSEITPPTYKRLNGLCTLSFAAAALVLISMQFYVKQVHSYYQFEKTSELHCRIDSGPAKGTYTDFMQYSDYSLIISDLEKYKSLDGKIAYLTVHPWLYLYTPNLENGTYSAWLSGESDNTLNRLEAYWRVNPDKIPDYVYMPKCAYFDRDSFLTLMHSRNYTVSETDTGYHAALNE